MLPELAPAPSAAAGFLICVGGVATLALKAWSRGEGLGSSTAAWPKLRGALLLAMSYIACVLGFGLSVGLVVWVGLASSAMLLLVFSRPWLPWLARPAQVAAPVAGIVVLFAAYAIFPRVAVAV